MAEPRLKGGVILGYFDFIRHQWGQEGLEECTSAVGIDPGSIQEERLYPLELDEAILRWISETKGKEFVRRTGQHTVKNLGPLSYLVRFVNIKHLLKKARDNYRDTFTYGEISVLSDEFSKRAVVIMKDSNRIEESCLAWEGALEGMLEVTRTKGTVRQTKRQIDGDPYDEFILDWE